MVNMGNAVECAKVTNCRFLYRPHLVHNPSTRRWVLFWNYVDRDGNYAGEAMATAETPAGPFSLVPQPLNLSMAGSGDFDVFVDAERDGAAYIIYSAYHMMFPRRFPQ